jgi:hypothetical protein
MWFSLWLRRKRLNIREQIFFIENKIQKYYIVTFILFYKYLEKKKVKKLVLLGFFVIIEIYNKNILN